MSRLHSKKNMFRWLFKCTGIAFSTHYILSLLKSVWSLPLPLREFSDQTLSKAPHIIKNTAAWPNSNLSSTLTDSSQMLQMGSTIISMQTDIGNLSGGGVGGRGVGGEKKSPTSKNRNYLKLQTQTTSPDLNKLIPFISSQSLLEPSDILGCSFTNTFSNKVQKKPHWETLFPNTSTGGNKSATCWKQHGKNRQRNSAAKQKPYILKGPVKRCMDIYAGLRFIFKNYAGGNQGKQNESELNQAER